MTDQELLAKVKSWLSVDGTYNDTQLLSKVLAAKAYLINAGITEARTMSELGITAISLWVNDVWNLTGGEAKFSFAFKQILTQLRDGADAT